MLTPVACQPIIRKSAVVHTTVAAAMQQKTPSAFSRRLASTLERSKRVMGLAEDADEHEEEDEEDWGCWEAMAISRAASASSLASSTSPSLSFSPSGSTLSSHGSSSSISSSMSAGSNAFDYFSISPPKVSFREFEKPRPAPRPKITRRERAMFDIVEEEEDEEIMIFPVTPATTMTGSPVGTERAGRFSASTHLFPTTPVFSTSPSLPALPAGASFESAFEEAVGCMEVAVDIATLTIEREVIDPASGPSRSSSSSSKAVLREANTAKAVTMQSYAEGRYHLEMTALPADYETESDCDISLCYSSTGEEEDSASLLDPDFSLEGDDMLAQQLAIERSPLSWADNAYRSKVSRFERKRGQVSKTRRAYPRMDSPSSPISMGAIIRNAALSAGVPGHAY